MIGKGSPWKIHIVNYTGGTKGRYMIDWLNGTNVISCEFDEADIVLFTGGEDIEPSYYNHKKNVLTRSYVGNQRDSYELNMFSKAVEKNKFIIGICRGCQLITVGNGGWLLQHVGHHGNGMHKVIGIDKKEYETNSMHHQMCWPYDLGKEQYQIIAYSKPSFFSSNSHFCYYSEFNTAYFPKGSSKSLLEYDFAEPEAIWYPQTRSFGIQGHPEGIATSKYVAFLNKFIKHKLNEDRNSGV